MGATKNDPLVPDSQFDDILKALVNNAISLETKQRIMQRACQVVLRLPWMSWGRGFPLS